MSVPGLRLREEALGISLEILIEGSNTCQEIQSKYFGESKSVRRDLKWLKEEGIGRKLEDLGLHSFEHFAIPLLLFRIRNQLLGQKGPLFDDNEKVICRCFGVTERIIRDLVNEKNIERLEQLADETFATAGCGSCRSDAMAIIREIQFSKVSS